MYFSVFYFSVYILFCLSFCHLANKRVHNTLANANEIRYCKALHFDRPESCKQLQWMCRCRYQCPQRHGRKALVPFRHVIGKGSGGPEPLLSRSSDWGLNSALIPRPTGVMCNARDTGDDTWPHCRSSIIARRRPRAACDVTQISHEMTRDFRVGAHSGDSKLRHYSSPPSERPAP